ncbi:MAG: peptidylprolyl isomerase [Bacteroidota bacterium]|nr:peptidylprolyl isomerase [Bacteroidota bacterium]
MFQTRLFLFLFFLLLLIGCSPKTSELVVAKYGDNVVKLGEYEKFYSRNIGGLDAAKKATQQEREDFLNLLMKYKLKLQDATDKNLLADPEIVQELNEYRTSLASTFMLEKELVEPSLKKLYKRTTEEIRASHILFRVDMTSSPEDTLKAYTKAMEIIDRVNKGEDFGKLAFEFSEDPSAKENSGDLYYFSSGQLVPEFEDAVYGMKVGEISQKPVRTAFGYHIIKATDRQPAKGSIRIRHIMARFNSQQPDSADSASAYSRIVEVLDSLKSGSDFHAIAVSKSEDGGSSTNGGDLGFFSRRRWVQPFDEAAFKLKAGEISNIVRTPYGFHILKCEEQKPLQTFEEMKPEIQRTFQSQRYTSAYNDYIANMKKSFYFSIDENVANLFVSELDSTNTTNDSAWDATVTDDIRKMILIKVGTQSLNIDSVINMLTNRQDFRDTPLKKHDLMKRFERIGDLALLAENSKNLETRFPDFKSLMQEYQDGVVLYKAEQLEVWNKLNISDTLIHEFFNNNRERFKFPGRVDYSEIYATSDSVAAEIMNKLQAGESFEKLADQYNEEPQLIASKGAHGLKSIEEDEFAKMCWDMEIGWISQPIFTEDGGYSILKVNLKEPSRVKTFEEAGVEVSNAFQEYQQKRLETEWLEKIKTKYPVQLFPEQLQKAFTDPAK